MNLFWYNFWYTDKNKALSFHQDHLTTQLIYLYINYGVLQKKNIFYNRYWYGKSLKNFFVLQEEFSDHIRPYFRRVEYKSKLEGEESQFATLRNKKNNLHFSKIWILRYQNWLVINLYMLQPLKRNMTSKAPKGRPVGFVFDLNKSVKKRSSTRTLIRYFLLIKYFKSSLFNFKNFYTF